MKRFLVLVLLLAVLAACGGSGGGDPTDAPSPTEETVATDVPVVAPTDKPSATESTSDNPTTDETPEVVEVEPTAESSPAGADLQMSGTDAATGLEINPSPIPHGVEFIVRGNVISMNLTPQTTPEFVVKSPGGQNYRIRPQGVPDIFLLDGSQLQPFQYRIGMLVQATVFIAVDAGPIDTLTSSDFIIINPEP